MQKTQIYITIYHHGTVVQYMHWVSAVNKSTGCAQKKTKLNKDKTKVASFFGAKDEWLAYKLAISFNQLSKNHKPSQKSV